MGPGDFSYLDYNATTPVLAEVVAAVSASLDAYGNPSSVHSAGRRARAAVENAREAVALLVGAKPQQVIFTSGGTEANGLALQGIVKGAAIFASAVEHPSVLAHAPPENLIPVTASGVIDLTALEARLQSTPRALVAVMLANNETGAIQPIARVAEIVHKHGGLLHCDAVQAPGKIAVDMAALGVDSLSLSAHKLGGVKGAGALIVRGGIEVAAGLLGGGQERRRRAGTENVLGIVAFGAAAREETKMRATAVKTRALRDELEAGIQRAVPRARIFAADVERLPNTTCVMLPGVSSETQLMRLDLAGVAVSAGSACSSGKIAPSHVLSAMGVPAAEAKCAIRISLGWTTTSEDIARFLDCWRALASSAAA